MLREIPQWWIEHSVSIVVLAEALCREGKSITSVCSSQDEVLPTWFRTVSRHSPQQRCHTGAQCWSLLLAHVVLMVSEPDQLTEMQSLCMTCVPASITTLFMSPMDNDRMAWERGQQDGSCYLLEEDFNNPFGEHSHETPISSHFSPLPRDLPTYLLFKFIWRPFFWSCALQVLTIQLNHPPQLTCWYMITCLAISPSKQSVTRCIARSSVHWKGFPSRLFFRPVPGRGYCTSAVQFWAVPAYGVEPSVKSGPSLLLHPLTLGTPVSCAIGASWEREGRV